jgi:hypothetical protein
VFVAQRRQNEVDAQNIDLAERLRLSQEAVADLKATLAAGIGSREGRERRRLGQQARRERERAERAEEALRVLKERGAMERSQLRAALRDARGLELDEQMERHRERALAREQQLEDEVFRLRSQLERSTRMVHGGLPPADGGGTRRPSARTPQRQGRQQRAAATPGSTPGRRGGTAGGVGRQRKRKQNQRPQAHGSGGGDGSESELDELGLVASRLREAETAVAAAGPAQGEVRGQGT